MKITRRRFLQRAVIGGAGIALTAHPIIAGQRRQGRSGKLDPDPEPRRSRLADTFGDLPRHFVFEYYPWYGVAPYKHWDEANRNPPTDLASNYMPALGAYDSGSTKVIEQHAEWIRGAGVGAINISWWGQGSDIDQLVPMIMDVMRANDVHVTFHLEPYTDRHALSYADDIRYLISKYGDARHWDCFLLLEDADGRAGPVFKSFRTILPTTSTDCHGVTTPIADYAADGIWRQQTDRVRRLLRTDFDRITLLADSLSVDRTAAGGFDGIAIYDNYVEPSTWRGHAENFSARNLVFSFNINPGFDGIALRNVDPGSCYTALPFEPGGSRYDWSRAADREAAMVASRNRIRESFQTTIALQTNKALVNAKQGFFLTYINSFNEWHEGDSFEPMKSYRDLSSAERGVGYHNPEEGSYRLNLLTDLIRAIEA